MKVTENSTYRLMQTNLDRISNDLLELRKHGATGLKLNKASDDPGAIRPLLTTRTEISRTDRYIETMGVTLDKMQTVDGFTANVENSLQRAKELAINSINGAMSPQDLNTLADEIAEITQQLVDTANSQIDAKHVFAGYEENTIPFVPNGAYDPALWDPSDSTTWPYIYQGDANRTSLEITPGEFMETNLTGNEVFFGVSNSNWIDATTPAAGVQPEPNSVDIFSVLTRLEEAVRAGNNDDPLGAGGGINVQIDNLDLAMDQNRRLRSRLGAKATRVESEITHQQGVKVDLEQILSRYQDADAIETFNKIVQQETAFQAALSVTSRVSQVSILDYF
jgi:flagellar hook-associated protein 3 FlgL